MLRSLLISTALVCAVPLHAGGVEDMVALEILPGWRAADGTHIAALHLRLAPGWKTFWRAPGDAGIPARFNVEGSENLTALEAVWPTPKVFNVAGMRTIGYERELVLPLRITPGARAEDIHLTGQVEMGICSDVCVPATLDLNALLPPSGAPDLRIRTALIDVPYSAEEMGVTDVTCATGAVQYGVGFRAEMTLPAMGGDEMVVLETSDPMIWIAEPRTWREGDRLIMETEMSHLENDGLILQPEQVRLTVIGDGQAVEIDGCPMR